MPLYHFIYRRLLILIFTIFLFCSCSGDYRNGKYTVGIDTSWFGVDMGAQQSNVTGFSRELLKEISKLKKIKLSLVYVNWDLLLPNLKEKLYNGILSPLYPYLFNQTYFDFSQPYLLTGPVLVLPTNSTTTSLEQLAGKEIAVLGDSSSSSILEKYPEILIRSYESIPDALNDIIAEVIDGAVIEGLQAHAYCRNIYHGYLKVVTAPLDDEGLRLVLLENQNRNLLKAFDEGLAELKKNGSYTALLQKWSLDQGP